MTKETHGGHRGRLSGKVRDGVVLYDHETLEVLLFNSCPRRDLNATAHALLDRFGDVYGVMHASVEELCSVNGVGVNMAEYIYCLSAVLDNMHDCESFAKIKSTAEFLTYVGADSAFKGGVQVCFVDKDGHIRRRLWIKPDAEGNIPLKDFYAALSASRPYGVFLCSFRESGDCHPTPADDKTVEGVANAVNLCGARFYDYCIIGDDGKTYSYFVQDRSVFGNKSNGGAFNG